MSSTPIVAQGYSLYSGEAVAGGEVPVAAVVPADSEASKDHHYVNADLDQPYALHREVTDNPSGEVPGEDGQGETPLIPGSGHEKRFQDVLWGIVFYLHVAGMMALIILQMISNSSLYHKRGSKSAVILIVLAAFVSIGLSTVALNLMTKYPREMVRTALIFGVATSLVVAVYALILTQKVLGILAFLSFCFGSCYAYMVWGRIDFAAANLNIALTAVRANMGLTVVAYGMMTLGIVWSVFWLIGFSSYLESYSPLYLFLLFVSFYWVHQVLQNTVHVTVAGVVGSWWFVPNEAKSFCSPAVNDSFFRAATYSFGSVCFGSLMVAVVQALRTLLKISEQNDDCNIMTCIISCILSCIQGIMEELNKWAYVYVGLYGMSYLEAGHSVVSLFEQRGVTSLITEDLADNVLFMVNVGIGLVTGLVGLIMANVNKKLFRGLGNFSEDHIGSVAFLFSFMVGFMFSSIFTSIVAGAVNTVIVCFTEAPAEFETNHPELSAELRAAWTQAWPELAF